MSLKKCIWIAFSLLLMLLLAVYWYRYCKQDKRQVAVCHLTLPRSVRSQEIACNMVSSVFQDTDVDVPIETNVETVSIKDADDRRQYREGYIAAMKFGILEIPIDFFVAHLSCCGSPKMGDYFSDTVYQHSRRINSRYYDAGASLARERCALFERQLWDDVMKTKWKHYEMDKKSYFSKGKTVPLDELKTRIEETPYLQALIFLQNKFKNGVLVHDLCPSLKTTESEPKTGVAEKHCEQNSN